MPRICIHWDERDLGDAGHTEEFCDAANKPCACCGDRGECTYPDELAAEAEAACEGDR